MGRAVARGLGRRSLDGLTSVGLDEKSFGKGHDYVSVLHDIPGRRVLDVVPDRTREAADTVWATIPAVSRQGIRACAMDMWENYMESSRAAAPKAAIVHDKFHAAKELNQAVDRVRRKEHREPQGAG
ncbi:MAG: transposase [Desulfosudis oleivorans]|nr:transposase [Desulfosudis oleivorans]